MGVANCYLSAHKGDLEGFRYTDHIRNYLDFLIRFCFGKIVSILTSPFATPNYCLALSYRG